MQKLSFREVKQHKGKIYEKFVKPEDYVLPLPLFRICKVCHKVSFSRKISVFDDNCIAVCSHCGARHHIRYLRIISKTLFTVLVFFILLLSLLIFLALNRPSNNLDHSAEKTTVALSEEEKIFNNFYSHGLILTPDDTLYLNEHSYEAKKVNPTTQDKWFPSSYYFDSYNRILWLEFSAVQEAETYSAWYPYEM